MLDKETKSRIDDCRDILVGKLPDPKSQIEQITIALIYKFMFDMDKEAVDLGGEAKFFADYKVVDPKHPDDRSKDKLVEFKKYGWDALFDTKVSSKEMLELYAEAIESIEKNPNIPELFRNIFKNSYLPYRDPETLRMFLKTIAEFEYSHSEKLGDAFEYLLSVMGSQGDAGQFRTPRHIIDFLVEAVDPSKTDTILDPACGTAGFLISAFKRIQEKNDGQFTPDEQKKMIQNFVGYDISPDMVRLSLVNLYLHGFTDPHIFEYDSLTSEDRWNDTFDVILANPPFMTPKGGIRPHKKFSVNSNRSEVLFVDYIAEHLSTTGKAGVIVPEGVIFQSASAYKDLRKMLVEQHLWAIVSLPSGVFNPYSGVKTSILLMDKVLAKKTDKILFVKIENDGYGLGAQRNAIKGGQLQEAIELLQQFKKGKFNESNLAHVVLKTEINKNGDYNLSGEKYKSEKPHNSVYELLELSEVCDDIFAGGDAPKEYSKIKTKEFNIPIFSNGLGKKSLYGYSSKTRVEEDAVTISARGTIGYATVRKAPFLPIVRLIVALPNKAKININYLKLALDSIDIYRNGNSIPQLTVPMIKGEKIPLPPLSIQEEIVAEIDGYQKVIDGAKMVIDNYRPQVGIDPKTEMIELSEVVTMNPKKAEIKDLDNNTEVSFVPMADLNEHRMFFEPQEVKTKEVVYKGYTYFKDNDVLVAKVTPCFENGKAGIAKDLVNGIGFGSSEFTVLRASERVYPDWIYYIIASNRFRILGKTKMTGTGGLQRVPRDFVENYKIPVPSKEVQLVQIEAIRRQQETVERNRELITSFEQKIKDRIAEVWGINKED
jgi:type I restriction enzyme M protein